MARVVRKGLGETRFGHRWLKSSVSEEISVKIIA